MLSASDLRRFGPLLVVAAATLACGGDELEDADGDGIADGVREPNNVTVVTPTRPLGHVAGQLLDALNDEPLVGARVELSAGGLSEDLEPVVTTEGPGRFEFGPIAAGAAFGLRFEAEGYAPVTLSGLSIDDTAGNFPTQNGALFIGPVRMLRREASFSVQVVSEEGAPVQGAEVTVETAARYLMDREPRGTVHGGAATDVDGRATVDGLPAVWSLPPSLEAAGDVTVHVGPVDLEGA